MATTAQKLAVKKLHIFGDGTDVATEYPFSEDGVAQAGKTTYDISHKDPYELAEVMGAGAVTFSQDFQLTVGKSGSHYGYKGTPTSTTPFGDLSPKTFGGVNVFMIETQGADLVKVLFTNSEHHSFGTKHIPSIDLTVDGVTATLNYYFDAYSDSIQYVKSDSALYSAIEGANGTTVTATISAKAL